MENIPDMDPMGSGFYTVVIKYDQHPGKWKPEYEPMEEEKTPNLGNSIIFAGASCSF